VPRRDDVRLRTDYVDVYRVHIRHTPMDKVTTAPAPATGTRIPADSISAADLARTAPFELQVSGRRGPGTTDFMPDDTDKTEPDDKRVQGRADALLPEEQEAESDDPVAQAGQILAESDARLDHGKVAGEKPVERRQSEDTVEPVDLGTDA
jgi:hypothetical protein